MSGKRDTPLLGILCPQTQKPPTPEADEHLKRQIGRLLFFRVIFLSLMLGSSLLLHSAEHPIPLPPLRYITWLIAALYLLSIASAILLQVIRCYSRFGSLQITLDALVVTLLVLATGGSQSIFPVVYFFPIVMGSFMLFRRGGILFAALSTLLYGLVLLIEYHGYLPEFLQRIGSPLSTFEMVLHFFSIHGLSFFLVGLLASMLSVRLQKTEAELFQTSSDYDRLSKLYKQIFDDIGTGIVTVDPGGYITSFNQAACRLSGYLSHEVTGKKIDLLFPGLRTIDCDSLRPSAVLTRKDGGVIPVEYTCSRLKSEDGKGDSRIYTLKDMSQIEEMQAKVQQAEKMATIGEMAAGIAHELRNPLAAISGSAQLLQREIGEDSPSNRLFGIIIRECDRLEATIHDFLLFSKPTAPEKDWFSFPALVGEVLETLRQDPAWDQRIKVHLEASDTLECWADQQLIRRVLINLLSNAANACRGREDGAIQVLAREESPSGAECEHFLLEVSDNGHGIAADALKKIFDPFFTTRENGTGLGLAIVRQIVEGHGGKVEAGNGAGEGAVFRVVLPLP